ncbi:MAG TPA: hypothetical protein VMH41_07160 [Mycobacteriales bacterium]|nr:hypothetical protein [Mycobacteriales bacterium]
MKRRFYSTPPWWLIILVPFTLLLVLIIALAIRKTVEGPLPACEACANDRRRFVTRVWVGWGVAFALLVLVAAVGSPLVGLLWLLVQLVVLVETFRGDSYRVRGKVSADGQWVELVGADEHFVREIVNALDAYASAAQVPMLRPPNDSQPPSAIDPRTPVTDPTVVYQRTPTILPGR